jgi:CRP-like cAMP-binding protein
MNAIMADLRKVPLFQRLGDPILQTIEATLTLRQISAGEVLFNMGATGEEMFIVREGRIAIYVPDDKNAGKEQPIRIFEPGEVLGEMALIDQQPRSLSGRALVTSEVWVLTGKDFRYLIEQSPEMSLAVMAGLNDRVRYTTQFLSEVREWVMRIAEGQYDRSFAPTESYEEPSIRTLAAEFAQMAAQVEKREQELRKEVFRLQIQIDESKKARQVSEIVESDYFQSLRNQARKLRGEP